MLCAHCSKTINRIPDAGGRRTNHFRSCDADVCSWTCALTRRDEISVFDPELNSPLYWQYYTSTNDARKPKLKRSSSERLLRDTSLYQQSISIDILPIICEENEKKVEKNLMFSVVLLFTVALSLICVVRL